VILVGTIYSANKLVQLFRFEYKIGVGEIKDVSIDDIRRIF
jgi:hypothetical protein